MRTTNMIMLISVMLIGAGNLFADEIEVGDSLEKVVSVLGKPTGRIKSKSYLLLTYPRGKVELRSNTVSRVDLIPQAAYEKQQKELAEQKARKIEQAKQQRAHLLAEGTRLRDQKLVDSVFINLPAGEQLKFWDDFRLKYPDVDITTIYNALKAEDAEQQKEDALQMKIQNLQAQVDRANMQAAQAQRQAAQAQQDAANAYNISYNGSGVYDNGGYNGTYYMPPVVIRNNYYHKENHFHNRKPMHGPVIQPVVKRQPRTYPLHSGSMQNDTIRSIRAGKAQQFRSIRRR